MLHVTCEVPPKASAGARYWALPKRPGILPLPVAHTGIRGTVARMQTRTELYRTIRGHDEERLEGRVVKTVIREEISRRANE